MTTFAVFSGQTLAHALGWSLLHFCWQGGIVAILLAFVLALLSGRPPQQRYAAACFAMALMVALPALTFVHLAMASPHGKSAVTNPAVQNTPALRVEHARSGTEPWLNHIAERLDRSVPWVLAVWFAGVILLLSRLNLGLLAARRMRSAAVQPAPAELCQRLHRLSRRLGVARPVELLDSALVQAPAVIGWLRPVVLMPLGCLAGLSPLQIEALLAHELAHIRRHDYLVNVFQSLVETLLFYHPAVWWVSRQVRREREYCCDDLAAGVSGDSLGYAKALSFLEEHRSAAPAVALGANGGALKMRIKRLLSGRETPAVSRVAALALLAVAVTTAGLYAGSIARAQTNTGEQPAGQSKDLKTMPAQYRMWLNQDVRWIITAQERAAFIQLANNNERDEFIGQFWERRNPAPGAAENTFREQHYHRIAYANQHFAAAGLPGWLTDRGRIYIVYGPPDEIDAHPSGTADSAKPSETWHYRLIRDEAPPEIGNGGSGYKAAAETQKDVDMKFVDVCNCGDYRLQPTPKS